EQAARGDREHHAGRRARRAASQDDRTRIRRKVATENATETSEPRTTMQTKIAITNISDAERLASALGGALLAAYGISQRNKSGAVLAAAGGALIVRGATGYCPGYAAAGVDRSSSDDTKIALAASRGTL